MARVADGLVKINDCIEIGLRAYPCVDRLALEFPRGGVVTGKGGSFKRSKSATKDHELLLMCALDKLLQPTDDLVSTHLLRGQCKSTGDADVIDPTSKASINSASLLVSH